MNMGMTEDKSEYYFTQNSFSDVKVEISIKRLIDKNLCLKYFEEEAPINQKNSLKPKIYLSCEILNGSKAAVKEFETDICDVNNHIQKRVIFNIDYSKLSYTSLLAFSVYSVDREGEFPIASTVVSLYDEMLKLREGCYLLL